MMQKACLQILEIEELLNKSMKVVLGLFSFIVWKDRNKTLFEKRYYEI